MEGGGHLGSISAQGNFYKTTNNSFGIVNYGHRMIIRRRHTGI